MTPWYTLLTVPVVDIVKIKNEIQIEKKNHLHLKKKAYRKIKSNYRLVAYYQPVWLYCPEIDKLALVFSTSFRDPFGRTVR